MKLFLFKMIYFAMRPFQQHFWFYLRSLKLKRTKKP